MRNLGPLRLGVFVAATAAWSTGCGRKAAVPVDHAEKAAQAAPKVTTPDPPTDAPAAPLDGAVHGWELGKTYAYTMKLSTRVDFEGAGNNFDFDIVGTLELDPATAAAGSATLRARLPDARIVTRIPGSQGELDKLAAELRSSSALFELTGGRAD